MSQRRGASKRQEQRKRAEFAVASDTAPRRPLSDGEIQSLLHAVAHNVLSKFGLVKLSGTQLDVLLPADEPELAAAPTLLRYAALRRRDGIVSGLLRAGADASVHRCSCATSRASTRSTRGVRQRMCALRPSFAAWVVVELVRQRSEALTGCAERCHVCRDAGCLCSLLRLDCGHVCCEVCWWNRTLLWEEEEDSEGAGVRCPLCAVQPFCALSLLSSEPSLTYQASLEAWRALPPEAPLLVRTRRPPFAALTRAQAAAHKLGDSQARRSENLLAAAGAGAVLRLAALLNAGVDAHSRNDYGQPALVLAAWHGHARCCRLLLRFGAQPRCDAAGVSPSMAARVAGHTLLADELRVAEDADEADQGVRVPPPTLPAPPCTPPVVTTLIEAHAQHPGAGAAYVDGAFDEPFLFAVEALFARLPVTPAAKETCSDRASYCDVLGWVADRLAAALQACRRGGGDDCAARSCREALPHMRFLHYPHAGSSLPAHTDLSRRHADGRSSTHTFVLFLTTCRAGGETRLLRSAAVAAKGDQDHNVLAAVTPTRGRLLLFPHLCPHQGALVVSAPKLLLRGEML